MIVSRKRVLELLNQATDDDKPSRLVDRFLSFLMSREMGFPNWFWRIFRDGLYAVALGLTM